MTLSVPDPCLVVLIGPSGSGKSTFAARHFGPYEIVSSDHYRAVVCDDEAEPSATPEAFDLVHRVVRHRLARARLTVVDATNVKKEDRAELLRLAKQAHLLPVAIVFDLPADLCHQRNQRRSNRDFGPHVIRKQRSAMNAHLRSLKREGFRHVWTLKSEEAVNAVDLQRRPLWNNLRHERGPFDLIGDVHGCGDELVELLGELGYRVCRVEADEREDGLGWTVTPPEGRSAIFLGDLVDRGPQTPMALRIAMSMVNDGVARCVPGNHEEKLLRNLQGKSTQVRHGLQASLEQLAAEPEPEAFKREVCRFLDRLVSHYVLDGGRLVVAHAGLPEAMQGRSSGAVRAFCLYGATTGQSDEHGLPVRLNWARDYHGKALVVYGHTPVLEPHWLNNTVNLDTGCVFGHKLTALRYPEREVVSVPAKAQHAQPTRPLTMSPPQPTPSADESNLGQNELDLGEALGKRLIHTQLLGSQTIPAERSAAALEAISRFAVDPRWLIHLPATMSPAEASQREGDLEHPEEAFAYYRKADQPRVICQAKHMGSRAVLIVGRDEAAIRRRFGFEGELDRDVGLGIAYTRTGRRLFTEAQRDREAWVLSSLAEAIGRAGLWDELQTDWLCLDAELMPWSVKADQLIRQQYAAVGAAGRRFWAEAETLLSRTADRLAELPADEQADPSAGLEAERERDHARQGRWLLEAYAQAYRPYCWDVAEPGDLRLAPFHALASEGRCHADRDHRWHLGIARRLAETDQTGLLLATDAVEADLSEAGSTRAAIDWWARLTEAGGEGMVVKPIPFIARNAKGKPIQPAIKCRGHRYLRLIYGPEYDRPEQLQRHRRRNVGRKRSLAMRQFALGIESLGRWVGREPLRRVHECVLGVLALQSEPVDPRL